MPRFNRKSFFAGFKKEFDPTLEQSQVDGIDFLLTQFEADNHWSDPRHVAYTLATIYHETAGSMQPVEEGYYLGKGAKAFQKKLRYYPFYGRGYVQLTWEKNYEKAGQAIGEDLVNKPERALNRDVAFKVMTLGMFRGWFTGKKLADYINLDKCDYVNARKIINGLDKAGLIAGYARLFEQLLKTSAAAIPATPNPASGDSAANVVSVSEQPPPIESPPAKERLAVVKGTPKRWYQTVGAKVTTFITGNAFFQWIWAQIELVSNLSIPPVIWYVISGIVLLGSFIWLVYVVWDTHKDKKIQAEIDALLIKENSTNENLAQLIPANEVALYRARGFKIITRGEKLDET